MIEQIIQYSILIHAGLGSTALVSGTVSIIAKKGNLTHKRFGKVFYYAMIWSTALSMLIALLPKHENPFLFSIGLFSLYLLISGYRAIKFKNLKYHIKYDKLMAGSVIIIGFFMIMHTLIKGSSFDLVSIFFGLGAVILGTRDLILFYKPMQVKDRWLAMHIAKITGGYIASVTAFFVVNQVLPGKFNWFVTTIVGSVYITYHLQRLQNESKR